jgi:hypothetical protein
MYSLLKIIVVIFLISFPSCKNSSDKKSEATPVVDKQVLIGNWIRTDFEYRISISKFNEDGTLSAQYFNPNQINVGKASWEESYGNVKLNIELRDENYPGSTYTLNYLPDRDMLAGDYYQAVESLTFYVEFVKQK